MNWFILELTRSVYCEERAQSLYPFKLLMSRLTLPVHSTTSCCINKVPLALKTVGILNDQVRWLETQSSKYATSEATYHHNTLPAGRVANVCKHILHITNAHTVQNIAATSHELGFIYHQFSFCGKKMLPTILFHLHCHQKQTAVVKDTLLRNIPGKQTKWSLRLYIWTKNTGLTSLAKRTIQGLV